MFPSFNPNQPPSQQLNQIYKNPFKGLGSAISSLFKPSQQQTIGGAPPLTSQIPGYSFNPYQIKTGDTFDTIAAASKMTPQDIQAANNGMLVPPPKGSYINLPINQQGGVGNVPYGPQTAPGYGLLQQWMNRNKPQPGGLVSPYPAAGASTFGAPQRPGSPFLGETAAASQYADIQNIRESIAAGQAPNAVPASMLAALGATPQSMTANGYKLNPATGMYTLQGAVGSNQALGEGDFYGYNYNPETGRSERVIKNAGQGASFYNELRWDPQRRKYVKIGQLMKEGKLLASGKWNRKGYKKPHRNRKKTEVAPVEAANASATPTDVLSLHLGGG